jgi:hypothetical protein
VAHWTAKTDGKEDEMIKVYVSSVREIGPRDRNGATSIVIGERDTLVFEGSAKRAAKVLARMPVGISVAVRHANGLRSCLNKPGLWLDIEGYSA